MTVETIHRLTCSSCNACKEWPADQDPPSNWATILFAIGTGLNAAENAPLAKWTRMHLCPDCIFELTGFHGVGERKRLSNLSTHVGKLAEVNNAAIVQAAVAS